MSTSLRALLAGAFTLAALAPDADASQTWPLGSEGAIAGIQLDYDPVRSLTSGPCLAADGCFKFNNSVETNYSYGGWLYLNATDYPVPQQADLDDTWTFYPVGWSESNIAQLYLPDAILDAFDIDIDVVVTPTFHIPGHPNITQSIPYTTTSAVTRAWGALPAPLASGGARSNDQSWLIEPGDRPNWVDSEVTLSITITPDPALLDSGWAGQSYTYEVPFPLHQQAAPFADVTPYFVPTSILGRPPGDQSWSRLTQSSGQAATMAVFESESSSQTVESSWGIGPFTHSNPPVTTSREETQGTYQEVSHSFALQVDTNNPYSPGEGDMMVGMLRPTFRISEAPTDLEFELVGSGDVVAIAMKELLNPTSTNSITVQNLNSDELSAFIDMNPLLTNPHARLKAPRYTPVVTFADVVGGSVGGGYSLRTITRAQVETALANSTTTTNNSSVTIPLGSIFSAVGVPLPFDLDINSRSSETTTIGSKYSTKESLGMSGGTMLEFTIGDSDPEARLCAEVFFDSVFRSFAFRDCNTEGLEYAISSLIETYELANPLPPGLTMVRVEDGEDSDYTLVGSLSEEEQEEGSRVRFIAQSEGAVDFEVALMPGTSNVVAPAVRPGKYTVTLNGIEYTAQLFEDGESTLEKVGDVDDDCATTTIIQDGCGELEVTVDACSEPATLTERYESVCDGVPSYEKYCEHDGSGGQCQYQDDNVSDEWSW